VTVSVDNRDAKTLAAYKFHGDTPDGVRFNRAALLCEHAAPPDPNRELTLAERFPQTHQDRCHFCHDMLPAYPHFVSVLQLEQPRREYHENCYDQLQRREAARVAASKPKVDPYSAKREKYPDAEERIFGHMAGKNAEYLASAAALKLPQPQAAEPVAHPWSAGHSSPSWED
jgi:hypothetical protein